EAGRAHEIGLTDAPLPQLRRLSLEAEKGPVEIERIWPACDELAHGEGIRLLLNNEVWKDRLHHHGRTAGKFGHGIDQPWIVELEVLAKIRQGNGGLIDNPLALAADEGRMAAGLVHLDSGALVEPEQAERDQEDVKDAGVIGVLNVLEHEFPVAGDALAHVAQNLELAAIEQPVKIVQHLPAEKILQRRHGE